MLNSALPIAFSVASSLPPAAAGAMIFGVGAGLVVFAVQVLHRCARTGNRPPVNPIPVSIPPGLPGTEQNLQPTGETEQPVTPIHKMPTLPDDGQEMSQPANQQPAEDTEQAELRSMEEIAQQQALQRKADTLNNTIKTRLEAFLQRCLTQMSEKITAAYTTLTRRKAFAAAELAWARADKALYSNQQKQQKEQEILAKLEQHTLDCHTRYAALKKQCQETEEQYTAMEDGQNKQHLKHQLSELQQRITLAESRLQFLEGPEKTRIQANLQKTAGQLSQAEQQRLQIENELKSDLPADAGFDEYVPGSGHPQLEASAGEAVKRVWQEKNILDYLTAVKNEASKLIDGEYTVANLIDMVTLDVFTFSMQYNLDLRALYADTIQREIPAVIARQPVPAGTFHMPDALKQDYSDLLQKFQVLLVLTDIKAGRHNDEISKKLLDAYIEVRLQLISCKSTEQFLDRQQQQDNQWFDEIEQFISQQANIPVASPAPAVPAETQPAPSSPRSGVEIAPIARSASITGKIPAAQANLPGELQKLLARKEAPLHSHLSLQEQEEFLMLQPHNDALQRMIHEINTLTALCNQKISTTLAPEEKRAREADRKRDQKSLQEHKKERDAYGQQYQQELQRYHDLTQEAKKTQQQVIERADDALKKHTDREKRKNLSAQFSRRNKQADAEATTPARAESNTLPSIGTLRPASAPPAAESVSRSASLPPPPPAASVIQAPEDNAKANLLAEIERGEFRLRKTNTGQPGRNSAQ